ncbi:MAG: inositol monophosphatase [Cyclobacteriaceae bacterium]|nr:inositol monophosphatase [Cyclobacteriaceae bacterium]
MVSLANLKKDVIQLCREVGGFIRKEAAEFDRSKIEFKEGFNNLVSYVDKEAEIRLVQALKKFIPDSGFITEEGTAEAIKDQEYIWIIDPLDGTTNFMHGLPVFAISIALAYKNKVVLGAVYDVANDDCYYAIENEPAYCNDKPIRVSSVNTLQESLLATGFPYYHLNKREVYLDIIKLFLEKTHGIRRLGSAAMDLAYVASGKMDGFFEYNLNAWDVAAGAFIVQQAGGKVTDFSGGDNFLYGGELVAAGAVHNEMLRVIHKLWFKQG